MNNRTILTTNEVLYNTLATCNYANELETNTGQQYSQINLLEILVAVSADLVVYTRWLRVCHAENYGVLNVLEPHRSSSTIGTMHWHDHTETGNI